MLANRRTASAKAFGHQADDLDRDEAARATAVRGRSALDVAHAAVAQAVDDHHHQGHDRQGSGHPDVAGGGAAEVRPEQRDTGAMGRRPRMLTVSTKKNALHT